MLSCLHPAEEEMPDHDDQDTPPDSMYISEASSCSSQEEVRNNIVSFEGMSLCYHYRLFQFQDEVWPSTSEDDMEPSNEGISSQTQCKHIWNLTFFLVLWQAIYHNYIKCGSNQPDGIY